MTIKIAYVADDGTSFNSKEACEEYERCALIKNNNDIKWFDKYFLPIEKIPANWKYVRFLWFRDVDVDQNFHNYVCDSEEWQVVSNTAKFEDYENMSLLSDYNYFLYWNEERWIDIGEALKK